MPMPVRAVSMTMAVVRRAMVMVVRAMVMLAMVVSAMTISTPMPCVVRVMVTAEAPH